MDESAKVLKFPCWLARPSEHFETKLPEGETCRVLTFHEERRKRGKQYDETQAGE